MSTICTTWFRRIAGIPTNRSEMYCAYSDVSVKLRGVRWPADPPGTIRPSPPTMPLARCEMAPPASSVDVGDVSLDCVLDPPPWPGAACDGGRTGGNAAEFILLGANTVQVCTGVMIHGYPLVQNLCAELQEFMTKHDFESIEDFRGKSLPYFTTHTDLVNKQREAIEKKKKAKVGIESDDKWTGDGFVEETESMVSN